MAEGDVQHGVAFLRAAPRSMLARPRTRRRILPTAPSPLSRKRSICCSGPPIPRQPVVRSWDSAGTPTVRVIALCKDTSWQRRVRCHEQQRRSTRAFGVHCRAHRICRHGCVDLLTLTYPNGHGVAATPRINLVLAIALDVRDREPLLHVSAIRLDDLFGCLHRFILKTARTRRPITQGNAAALLGYDRTRPICVTANPAIESERRTRRARIDPRLRACGWQIISFGPRKPLSAYSQHAIEKTK
jgi:hypothetical protein